MQDVKLLQYADDIVVFTDIYPVQEGLHALELVFQNISIILKNVGLDTSTNKTNLCIFSHLDKELKSSRRIGNRIVSSRKNLEIIIDNVNISHSSVIKFSSPFNLLFLGAKCPKSLEKLFNSA